MLDSDDWRAEGEKKKERKASLGFDKLKWQLSS